MSLLEIWRLQQLSDLRYPCWNPLIYQFGLQKGFKITGGVQARYLKHQQKKHMSNQTIHTFHRNMG